MSQDDRLLSLFLAQSEAFELAFEDDDWTRYEGYFIENAVYETLGRGGERFEGRSNVIGALKRALANFDRRCDSRRLVSTAGPFEDGREVTRTWACTFTLAGVPDLVIEGDERAIYRGELIDLLQEQLTVQSRTALESWVARYAKRLRPRRD